MLRRFAPAGFLLLCTATLTAQQKLVPLRGSVVDPTAAIIPGATILLQTPAGAPVAQAIADQSGNFTLSAPPGNYLLVLPAFPPFAPIQQKIHLPAAPVTLTLNLASFTDEVTISAGEALSTDSSANTDAVAVTGNQLRKLPVFDQNYVAALIPFLDPSSSQSDGVTLIVDGVEVKRLNISPSAIGEVRINNDPYASEFTRPGRGRIEIVSKPGTPNFHGEFNFTYRNAIFNAKNYFATVRPPESRRIFEGHLSGPVGRGGHTSFILSGARYDQQTASIVAAVLPSGPFRQNVPTPSTNPEISLRVTHDFSPTHRLSLGYTWSDDDSRSGNVGGLVLAEAGQNVNEREDDVIINDRLILTPKLINQLQIQLEKQDNTVVSVTAQPSVLVSGAFTAGGAQSDLHRSENTIHLNNTLSWSHGRHYVRAGIQLPQFSRRGIDDRTNRLGTYRFASLVTYAANQPYSYTVQQGPGRVVYWINEFGTFFQDQIALTPRLQLLAGLRFDRQSFLPDINNFAPRLSLAYAPGAGKTILRTGTGVFYDRTGGDFPSTTLLHNGLVLRTLQLQNPPYPVPPGIAFAAVPSNIVRFDPRVRTPYALQYSAGIERRLAKNATLTLTYRGQVQVKSFRSRDANAPILPPNPSLTADYPRPDSTLGRVQQIESGGRGLLNALDLQFRGDLSRWFSGQAQYTLSRSSNNTSAIDWFPPDQYHPNDNWARARDDRRQRFNLLGNINPDHWLSLGIAVALATGTPYSQTTGNDDYHTGLGNARPPGVGRNTLSATGNATVDLLYNHDFLLGKHTATPNPNEARVFSVGLSAFNVFNTTNYLGYVGALNSPLYGQPTSAQPGRQLQLSAGYRF